MQSTAPLLSIGEVESLVLKAYRGAGFSWGMSQEAGKAASWMTRKRLPALDAFASLLGQTAAHSHDNLAPDIDVRVLPDVWRGKSGLLCPVITGVLLSDLGAALTKNSSTIQLASVASPLILLPYAAALPVAVGIKTPRLEMHCGIDNLEPAQAAQALSGIQDITLEFAAEQSDFSQKGRNLFTSANVPQRGTGTADSVALLERLAHRTYVPATRESRESGAGAGLQDND